MIWSAWKHWRRRRILATAQIDQKEWRRVIERFEFTRLLSAAEQASLKDLVVLFLHEKRFAVTHDLQLTPPMQLHIAVQACVLVLYLGLDYYRGWSEIILYPAEFVPRHQYVDEMGVVHQGDHAYSGEAWLQGPVILSWADVAQSERPDGVNVVIHEFAHKLDMLNGDANGFPPLHKDMSREAWSQTFSNAYGDFSARVDRMEETEIDPYAAESPGEFFAVISEVFFELPDLVAEQYPQVYAQLAQFYRQDPLARLRRQPGIAVAATASPVEV